MTRVCRACAASKPACDFYAHSSDCKDCSRAAARERMRVKRRDAEFRAVERDRAATFRAANPDTVRAQAARHKARIGLEDRTSQMPDFDLTKPITYDTAHGRVVRWRGRARIHECSRCDAPATNWAYRHDSPFEQLGETNAGGRRFAVRFSPDPMDYDPMCRSCHTRFDWAKSRTLTSA